VSANLGPRHENRLHRLLTEKAKNRYDLTVSARIDSFGLIIAAGFFSVCFPNKLWFAALLTSMFWPFWLFQPSMGFGERSSVLKLFLQLSTSYVKKNIFSVVSKIEMLFSEKSPH